MYTIGTAFSVHALHSVVRRWPRLCLRSMRPLHIAQVLFFRRPFLLLFLGLRWLWLALGAFLCKASSYALARKGAMQTGSRDSTLNPWK